MIARSRVSWQDFESCEAYGLVWFILPGSADGQGPLPAGFVKKAQKSLIVLVTGARDYRYGLKFGDTLILPTGTTAQTASVYGWNLVVDSFKQDRGPTSGSCMT